MPGGIIQLAVYGGQDYYLTSNPQISFFKSVYRRHTNFSMEFINLLPEKENELNNSTEQEITFKLFRHGDLVKDVYFVFTLPDIYSGAAVDKFRWIRRIGEYIIKEIKIRIGVHDIDTQYGEWLNIWREMTLPESQKDGYNKMIGNLVEMYDPEKIPNISAYPEATASVPSIHGRKIYVPLNFWFNQSYGNALPLIAMQYDSEPEIIITLRELSHLYNVVSGSDVIRPAGGHNIGKYLDNAHTNTATSLDISPSLEANYIFLDKDERKRFALVEHQYLIRQIQRVSDTFTPQSSNTEVSLDLKIQHPTSALYWYVRRSDLEDLNQWDNFTNWPTADYDPLKTYDGTVDNNPFAGGGYTLADDASSFKSKDIVRSAIIKLNGVDRFSEKDTGMFNLVNNFQHHTRIPKDGIYCYSFGIDTNKYQPSGSCNMSRFNKIQLQIILQQKCGNGVTGSGNYNYTVNVYALNYNIFRLVGGLGDVEFSN